MFGSKWILRVSEKGIREQISDFSLAATVVVQAERLHSLFLPK